MKKTLSIYMYLFFFRFVRFRTLLPWWIFYTSDNLLLFVPLSRHLPPSSPPHPSPEISLAFLRFYGLFTFPSSINFPRVWCIFIRRKYLNFCFLIEFRSVPDETPSSSAMDWFVLGSVHDTHKCTTVVPLL